MSHLRQVQSLPSSVAKGHDERERSQEEVNVQRFAVFTFAALRPLEFALLFTILNSPTVSSKVQTTSTKESLIHVRGQCQEYGIINDDVRQGIKRGSVLSTPNPGSLNNKKADP